MTGRMDERETGYRGIVAWQRAMDLTVEAYGFTRSFPDAERFGLTSQMQRAAASIPANIAEGYDRGSDAEFARFLSIGYGSLCELETFAQLAFRLDYIDSGTLDGLIEKTSATARVLYGLKKRLNLDRQQPTKSPPRP